MKIVNVGDDYGNERRERHTCHARGCSVRVPPERLMCARHWRMVPTILVKAVWATYRHGQCDDMRPSREWLRAAHAAIGAVARLEKRALTLGEIKALASFSLGSFGKRGGQ